MLRSLRIENLALIRDADLEFVEGLNVVTGETGAGKTIFAQAIGLLLGARGDAASVGSDGSEAYIEAVLEVPDGFFAEEDLEVLTELRPSGEEDLTLARRVFAEGRTRAYAWGRSVPREDLAAAGERLIAMSGQFEQRRLARPAFQLDVLDAYCGPDQLERRRESRVAWRELIAARRQTDELTQGADAREARTAELEALVADTDGLDADDEDTLKSERERLRHVTELGAATTAAVQAIAPDDGEGAASLTSSAESAVAAQAAIAPELEQIAGELHELAIRLREAGSDLHRFAASLDADPGRLEEVERRLAQIADTKRRYGCNTYEALLALRGRATAELDGLAGGDDSVAAATAAREAAAARVTGLADGLHAARVAANEPFTAAVTRELRGVGMGEGDFELELREREPGPTGRDQAEFLIRPNAGLPFAPVAETASGGELSRVALALAAVAGGETLVFDEIDAGIGGETAHHVAQTLRGLSRKAQVITITHLPQIAATADAHFRVEKISGDPTHTRITRLDDPARQHELERMAGGREFLAALASGDPS